MRSQMLMVSAFTGLIIQAQAAAPADPWQRMQESKREVINYLIREARRVTDAAAAEMASKETWESLREQRRREFRDMMGLDPLPLRTPLHVRVTGILDKGEYTIEKIAFESMPKVYVTANLYVPQKREGPLPTVVYVCGHAGSAAGAKASLLQRHPITLAQNGYVCMILDPIQSAEVFGQHHGVYNLEKYEWYSRGYNPSGVEVWNVIRALDYLETRPEVDKNRFGITGISGGSNETWFSTALDSRLKVAVPVMGISTYAAYVANDTQSGHCDCVFPINIYLHDPMTLAALISPRPLCMMHGRKDVLSPVAGYEEVEARAGQLYEAYGVREKFRNIVVDTAHADSDFLREQAVRWFDRWLKQIPSREIKLDCVPESPEHLSVFSGHPPADAQNYRVHEILTPGPPTHKYADLRSWEGHRLQLVSQLREKVFRAFPPPPKRIEFRTGGIEVRQDVRSIEFESEPGITVQAIYRPVPGKAAAALLYVASNEEDFTAIESTLDSLFRNRTNPILIVYPRGVGEVPWEKSFWKTVMRNAVQVGRTVDSMRLWDVLRAAQLLRSENPDSRISTLGTGVSGVLGMYAAVLDEQISQVILNAPPVSHRDAPIFLDVLRYTDLPEVAALLAPRRLLFYNRIPDPYRFSQDIYGLYGKHDHMALSLDIEAAVNGRSETYSSAF